MRRKIIFLDMDGVLANFHKATFSMFSQDFDKFIQDEKTKKQYPLEYAIHKWMGVDESFMWECINEAKDFWFEIEPYPWIEEFYKSLVSEKHWIIISTSPGIDLNAHSQKMRWIQKHLPWHNLEDVMLGKRKHLLARQGRVLIDDYRGNTHAFNLAGGSPILFPQPWNRNYKHIENRFQFVLEELNKTIEPTE